MTTLVGQFCKGRYKCAEISSGKMGGRVGMGVPFLLKGKEACHSH